MNQKLKTIILIAIFSVFILLAILAYRILSEKVSPQNNIIHSETDASDTDSEKIKAFDFTVLDNEGNEVKLSDLFGKPIVLNFWASWCSPCKSEMPVFDKIYKEMQDEITFIMVDLIDGQRETMKTGKDYINEQGFSFPVYYDTEGEAGYVYSITSIPTTIFIDKDGYIITGVRGAIDENTLLKGMEYIIESN